MTPRPIIGTRAARPTLEGAGVRLHRVFGEIHPDLDPFLLLDDFGSEDPSDYIAGFPLHPHRGIETITYMIQGRVRHKDSLGNAGVIGPGDVQWMTAGAGILHEEMPLPDAPMSGLQLWANLPRSQKMIAPRYQDVLASSIPLVELGEGVTARLVAGSLGGIMGPVTEIAVEPILAEITLSKGAYVEIPLPPGHNALACVLRGELSFGPLPAAPTLRRVAVIFGKGDALVARALQDSSFLLAAARPLREPVAWGGPIVMNTEQELATARRELRDGTFIKARRA